VVHRTSPINGSGSRSRPDKLGPPNKSSGDQTSPVNDSGNHVVTSLVQRKSSMGGRTSLVNGSGVQSSYRTSLVTIYMFCWELFWHFTKLSDVSLLIVGHTYDSNKMKNSKCHGYNTFFFLFLVNR
jgi:hypothetical protein